MKRRIAKKILCYPVPINKLATKQNTSYSVTQYRRANQVMGRMWGRHRRNVDAGKSMGSPRWRARRSRCWASKWEPGRCGGFVYGPRSKHKKAWQLELATLRSKGQP